MKIQPNDPGTIEKVDFKNYKLGERLTAYVGEEILARKSYSQLVTKNHYEAKNPFTFKGGIASTSIKLSASTGDTFKISGNNEKGNDIVDIPNTIFKLGIDQNGNWDQTVVSASFWTSPVGSGSQYKMEPVDTKFEKVAVSTALEGEGYINHELVFTGVGANGITLLYREYTLKNNARSAFSQDLVYPMNAKEIRFRNYKINILSVSSSEIVYLIQKE